MNARNTFGMLALGLVVGTSLVALPRQAVSVPASKAANEFAVDAVHSSLIFKISHMGVANFYGRFNSIDGSYTLDEENAANSAFRFEVKADSIDTANSRRDGHLKSADFFNVTEYPTISFKSTKVEQRLENHLNVTGDLNLHGVTKPVVAQMQVFPAKNTRQGAKGGFEAVFTIKRSEFGMNYGVSDGGLGDDVTIIVAVEGAKK